MLDIDMKRHMLYKMLEIRVFEEKVSELRYDGDIYGAVHCCIGQEAVAVGACQALDKDDYIMGTHRSHGYMLAKGADMNAMMAELFGRATGTNGGRGGSLHVCDVNVGALGATGIVGSGLPVACGAAFASKYKKDGRVTLVFLGDGACNEGTFHESMNLASRWKLPVVFLLENNGVAVTTLNSVTTSVANLYKRAEGYGMPGKRVNGQNPEEIFCTAADAVSYAKTGNGPVLIEAMTHRFHEHAEGKGYLRMEGAGYRDETIKKQWINEEDPVKNYYSFLKQQGYLTHDDFKRMKNKIVKEVNAAVDFAINSSFPQKSTVLKFV